MNRNRQTIAAAAALLAVGVMTAAGGVWNTRGREYYYKRANVGIGTKNPAYPLDVRNKSRSRTLNVDNTDNAGTRYGVYSRAKSPSGRGVYGYASASSGSTMGVYGRSNSTSGNGVYGLATSASGQAYGVYGETHSTNSYGVYGQGPVRGIGGNATGDGSLGIGVLGNANADGFGFRLGVSGNADATGTVNYGVYGIASSGNFNYGVYGEASGSNPWAGWFAGNANVTGTLSKGGGAFRIDHPLDPENKYLLHSFVESPDMMNIYNGNVVTDADGYATITMPEWFEALNRDFRYQLTVIGSFARAMVAEEIEGNSFAIATDEPFVKVSWMVTGIRQDPFADANRIPVEQDKRNEDRGAYLHPEAWGRPDARRIGALEDADLGE